MEKELEATEYEGENEEWDFEEASLDDKKGEPTSLEVKVMEHVVKKGECLWTIAKQYGIDIETIASVNSLERFNLLSVGKSLKIYNIRGILHVIQPGQTLSQLAQTYKVSLKKILAANHLEDSRFIQEGQAIFVPGAKVRKPKHLRMIWPMRGRLTSGYGFRLHPMGGGRLFHGGIDIAAPCGRKVTAVLPGKVVYVGYLGSYGKTVKIRHENGMKTLYAHNSSVLVRRGQKVEQGKQIARSGNTGRSTGPHLHFEVMVDANRKNPLRFLP